MGEFDELLLMILINQWVLPVIVFEYSWFDLANKSLSPG